MIQYKEISIYKEAAISDALKQMDAVKKKLLLVLNKDFTFHSLISIGDIQRAIIANLPVTTPIYKILRDEVMVAHINDNPEEIKNHIRQKRNDFMPVIDAENNIVNIIFWEDLFKERQSAIQFNLPVVIMAGGRGSRLKPLTNVIPKPLIPINEKTIIEDIMDRFVIHGCHQFYLSINYKAELIRYYFDNLNNVSYSIDYFQEEKPLGTAGSLSMLKGKINQTFFVSNCDILIDQDYSEILKYHRENKNDITIVAALKHYSIPYGTIETSDNGQLAKLTEKPELTFKINSGMYIIEPNVINKVPTDKVFHMTDLIDSMVLSGSKVGVFPVSEGSWEDIGELRGYLNLIK